jgi:hypothetical protein
VDLSARPRWTDARHRATGARRPSEETPMFRAAALLPLLLIPASAVAGEASEVCVLTVTETITAPKKPNIFETVLDCGEPSEAQAVAAQLVNNAMNEAVALEVMTDRGYEIETGATWISYTGRQLLSRYVLVMEDEDSAPAAEPTEQWSPSAADLGMPTADPEALPEAEDDAAAADATDATDE